MGSSPPLRIRKKGAIECRHTRSALKGGRGGGRAPSFGSKGGFHLASDPLGDWGVLYHKCAILLSIIYLPWVF